MEQVVIILFVFLSGLLVSSSYLNSKNLANLMILSLPVGLALTVLSMTVLVLFSLPLSVPAVFLLDALLIGLKFRWVDLTVKDGLQILASILVVALISYGLTKTNFTILSFDSYSINNLAQQIADTGRVSPLSGINLSNWGSFLVFIHTLGALFKVQLFWVIHPLLTINFFVFFLYAILRLVKIHQGNRSELMVAVVVTLAMFTNYFILFQSVYLHNSLPSSFFLFIAAAQFFIYRAEREKVDLDLAVVGLISFSLLRNEAPLIAATFLFFLFSLPEWTQAERKRVIYPFAFVMVAWYLKLLDFIGGGGNILTPDRIVMVVIPALVLLTLIDEKLYSYFSRGKLQYLLPLVLVAALGLAFAFRNEHILRSISSVYSNLTSTGYWGNFWYFVGPIFILFSVGRLGASTRMISLFVISFLLVLILMSLFRVPYRIGWGDSANRIVTHIVPLVLMFIVLRMLELFKKPQSIEA